MQVGICVEYEGSIEQDAQYYGQAMHCALKRVVPEKHFKQIILLEQVMQF